MEVATDLGDSAHGDLRSELTIEAALKAVGVERCVDGEAHDLADGVYTGVGAPCDNRLDITCDAEQGGFQVPLDGPYIVLPGVTVKSCPVVCEVDAIGRHARTG